MKPTVSCIIPAYNESRLQVLSALHSVLKSSYSVSEIIVVDDGSRTPDIRDAVGEARLISDIDIVYFRKDNDGPAAARNAGAALAKSEWLAFLDADDIYLENGLRAKVDYLASNSSDNLGGVYGRFLWSDTGGEQKFIAGLAVSPDWVGVAGKAPGGVPSYLIRKEAFDGVGGFNSSLSFNEDFDLLLRMMSVGYVFYGVQEPGFIRVINPDSLTRSDVLKSLGAGREFLRKAFHENLLSKREVFRRYMLNYLSVVRFLFRFVVRGR